MASNEKVHYTENENEKGKKSFFGVKNENEQFDARAQEGNGFEQR